MAAGSPASAGRLSFWATERSPVWRRVVHQILDGDTIVCLCLDQHRSTEVAALNQTFEHGERQRAGGIDDWDPWWIPTSAIERGARPVPDRMQACAEPVEPQGRSNREAVFDIDKDALDLPRTQVAGRNLDRRLVTQQQVWRI